MNLILASKSPRRKEILENLGVKFEIITCETDEHTDEKDGRKYTECDIDTLGAEKRGAKRIVFSNDGLIYYTDDHYESFTLLYGEP